MVDLLSAIPTKKLIPAAAEWNNDLSSIVVKFPESISLPIALIFGVGLKLLEDPNLGLKSAEEAEELQSDEEDEESKKKKKSGFSLRIGKRDAEKNPKSKRLSGEASLSSSSSLLSPK